MTPVIYNDVLAAVSALSGAPIEEQRQIATRLLADADLAERYRQSRGHAHPVHGDGSLLAVSLRYSRRGDASFQTVSGLRAWITVLTALLERLDHPEAQLMHRGTVGSSSKRFGEISSPQSSQ